MRRLPALTALASAVAGLVVALWPAGEAPRAATVRSAALRVDTRLPTWLAPGARLRVDGWAGANENVRLVVGERRIARARSGRLGRFRLAGPAPRPGRYGVAVVAGGNRLALGPLLVRPIRLAAVGDVRLLEGTDPWAHVGALLRAADIATANLETAASRRGVPVAGKKYTFRGPPEAVRAAARRGGIDVLTLANNHALDYGREAFLDTLRHTRAAGIAAVGGGASLAAARRPAVLEAGGVRIAFLGYSDVNPLGFRADAATPGTAAAVPEHVAEDVRAARRRVDVVVCWFHWGEELRAEPTWRQQTLAAAALNAGAQVVLGSHPHVLGRVTVPRRRSLVAWTLGNFVFPSFRAETVRTGVLLVRLDARGVRGHDLVPARIEGYRPRLSLADTARG